MVNNKIPVTSPLLPELEEFIPYLQEIWQSRQLTNGGHFHQKFERELAAYLGVEHLCLFANGTLALLTALQALRITGEVITTPYSFVATSHALTWNRLKPIYVDIDPRSCNLDPAKIEAAITPDTTAILPIHCYGIPCDVVQIQDIADRYGLKVIYDAAHAFGVKQGGETLLQWGDLSVLSFHATKIFNTFEGGAIICPDAKTKKRIDYLKNFGFADEVTVVAPGINGKMNEVQAAFGLLQLKHIAAAIDARKKIFEKYSALMETVTGLRALSLPEKTDWNYSYYPVFVDSEQFPLSRDQLYSRFRENNILARRYFYPLISEFPMYRGMVKDDLSHAEVLSRSVLCLPIYPHMGEDEFQRIQSVLCSAAGDTQLSCPA